MFFVLNLFTIFFSSIFTYIINKIFCIYKLSIYTTLVWKLMITIIFLLILLVVSMRSGAIVLWILLIALGKFYWSTYTFGTVVNFTTTLDYGLIFIHPYLLYSGVFCIIVVHCSSIIWEVFWVGLQWVWKILSWATLTGALWGLVLDQWGFYWLFDFVEWVAALFFIYSIVVIHTRVKVYNYTYFGLTLWFLLLFLILVRFGVISSIHSFVIRGGASKNLWIFSFWVITLVFVKSYPMRNFINKNHWEYLTLIVIILYYNLIKYLIIYLYVLLYFMLYTTLQFTNIIKKNYNLYFIHLVYMYIYLLLVIKFTNWFITLKLSNTFVNKYYSLSFTPMYYWTSSQQVFYIISQKNKIYALLNDFLYYECAGAWRANDINTDVVNFNYMSYNFVNNFFKFNKIHLTPDIHKGSFLEHYFVRDEFSLTHQASSTKYFSELSLLLIFFNIF